MHLVESVELICFTSKVKFIFVHKYQFQTPFEMIFQFVVSQLDLNFLFDFALNVGRFGNRLERNERNETWCINQISIVSALSLNIRRDFLYRDQNQPHIFSTYLFETFIKDKIETLVKLQLSLLKHEKYIRQIT